MLAFVVKRLALAVLVAVTVSAIAFLLLRASGDIATALAGEGARRRISRTSAASTGSTGRCSCNISTGPGKLLRGDFGHSLYFKTGVGALVLDKLPTTALLALFSLIFALAVSVPLGVLAAVYPNSADRSSLPRRSPWPGRRCRISSSRSS